jgi:hypothetical protein
VPAHARCRDWRPAGAQHDMRFHTQASRGQLVAVPPLSAQRPNDTRAGACVLDSAGALVSAEGRSGDFALGPIGPGFR